MGLSEAELRALMTATLDGDAGAYRLLLGDLRRRLRGFFARRLPAGSADADDLVQDTLMAIHARRATYDRREAFAPWVYGIARYKLVDHFRRQGRRATVPLEDVGALFIEDASAGVDARGDVERMLATLPEPTRAILRSVKLDELSCAEEGVRSGRSAGAVKVAVHRAMRSLGQRFGPDDGGRR